MFGHLYGRAHIKRLAVAKNTVFSWNRRDFGYRSNHRMGSQGLGTRTLFDIRRYRSDHIFRNFQFGFFTPYYKDNEEIYCSVRTGLFCDFLCPNYAIRIACCECVPPSIGTPFKLMQDGMCVRPRELRTNEKVVLDADCQSDAAVWQWGKGRKISWIKNFSTFMLGWVL